MIDILFFLFFFIFQNWIGILSIVIVILVMKHFKKFFPGPTLWEENYYESIAEELKENPDAYSEKELQVIIKDLDEDLRIIEKDKKEAGNK